MSSEENQATLTSDGRPLGGVGSIGDDVRQMLSGTLFKVGCAIACATILLVPQPVKAENSSLAVLGACAFLQEWGLVLPSKVDHVHAIWHPLPTLDSLDIYIAALRHRSSRERAYQQDEINKGRNYGWLTLVLKGQLDRTCAKAVIMVHREFCTENSENTLGPVWIPRGISCDPMDLLSPLSGHHPNEQILQSALDLFGGDGE